MIGVVALVVIGPEKLPKVARTVGHLLGRAQRYVNDVKADINREMELDELRKLQSDMQTAARDIQATVNTHVQNVESGVHSVVAQVQADTLPDVAAPPLPAHQEMSGGQTTAESRLEGSSEAMLASADGKSAALSNASASAADTQASKA